MTSNYGLSTDEEYYLTNLMGTSPGVTIINPISNESLHKRIQDLESQMSALKISLKATQNLLTTHITNWPECSSEFPGSYIHE